MKKLLFFFSLLISLGWVSCNPFSSNTAIHHPNPDTLAYLSVPFDTVDAFLSLNIRESQSFPKLLENDSTKGLSSKLDTLEARYVPFACDCQDWFDYSPYQEAFHQQFPDWQEEEIHFLDHELHQLFGYYLEPASPEIELPWVAGVTGNIVRFIGREYQEIGYPQNPGFIDPDPPKGKVFRYYAYEIQRPYQVWAPRVWSQIDSMAVPNKLTIMTDFPQPK
ncbi:MAG: hypothetical protein AAF399_17710 [Bacteroidota bacterium]